MTHWPWALAALAVLAALPLLLRLARRPLAAARKDLPGRLVRLPRGLTHVRTDGQPGRPVVVLVHGLTTPAWVFDSLAGGLAVQGWRVLRYDLWGRGGSSRVRGAQGRALFVEQLEGVLEAEAPEGPVVLVGYSMGAAIAAACAEAHPARVRALAMLAPAGLGVEPGRLAAFCARTPVAGDWLWAVAGGAALRRAARRAARAESPSAIPDLAARLARESRTRGYLPAVLSSCRNMLAEDMGATHRALARAGVPVLALWGEEDEVIPPAAARRLAEANPEAVQQVVKGAGHGLPHTHPREVLKAIRAFAAYL